MYMHGTDGFGNVLCIWVLGPLGFQHMGSNKLVIWRPGWFKRRIPGRYVVAVQKLQRNLIGSVPGFAEECELRTYTVLGPAEETTWRSRVVITRS